MIRIEADERIKMALGPTAGLTRFLNTLRAVVGVNGDIDVLLADDTTLRRLNRVYRGKNQPTDVLSFPAAEMESQNAATPAGDLAISLETAAKQAAEHGHTLRDEVRVLLLHGTLHLAGYDHEADSGEMAAKEAELRIQLRLPCALIARTEVAAAGAKTRASRAVSAGAAAKRPADKTPRAPKARKRMSR